jgi:hypothetical protein
MLIMGEHSQGCHPIAGAAQYLLPLHSQLHMEEGTPMLRSVNELRGLTIHATDNLIGSVDEFYFDDQRWSIRYMVVNVGSWMSPAQVLISPRSIRTVDWEGQQVSVKLTRRQVQDAPSAETDQPVSRQMELAHAIYYNYDPYWYGPGLWGGMGFPYLSGRAPHQSPANAAATERQRAREAAQPLQAGDTHLRSTRAVTGYHIRASDGEIGHVDDFVMDDETWAVRYLVVDTSNWWLGTKVLVAPTWITGVSWNDRIVDVDLTGEAIKAAPPYDPAQLNRAYEKQIHRHYRRETYWEEAPPRTNHGRRR